MLTEIKNPNWWRRRTSLEKCLLLVSAFACIALIAFVSVLELILLKNQRAEGKNFFPHNKITSATHNALALNGSNIAATQNGVTRDNKNMNKLTLEVLSKMKTEVKPCDDFYQFACGRFIDETQIPNDKVEVNIFTAISDKLQDQLKAIITEERSKTEPKPFQLPNALYKACMNEDQIESLGTTPIQQISDSLGGWPVVVGNSWDCNNTWTWQETVKKFRYLGFSTDYIFEFAVIVDTKNNTRRMIDLDQASFGLSREYLVNGFNDTRVSAYYDYMVDLAVLFGAKKEKALKELKESLQFEMELAKISLPSEELRNFNDLYNLRSIKEMQETYPYVQWLDYINALLPENVKVDESEIINVEVPRFFNDLGKLLNRTDKRVIANYMMWRIHAYSVDFLSKKFRDRQFQYTTAVTGKQEQEARWKKCVNIVSQSLQIAMGALYVRQYFDPVSKVTALEMVNDIREVFSQMLDEVTWMDDNTQQKAKKKLQSMAAYVGYPDEMLDEDKLEKYYNKLEIDPDKYFESCLNMKIFSKDYEFSQLRLRMNNTDWRKHAQPAVVNAFYNPFENSIEFPAGILQDQLFDSQRPNYLNYGAIGFVIGHEITHGFDDQGCQFDANGNLVNWWQNDTEKAFLEKANCIIAQYANYTDKQTGLNLNGINTQGENIADNGGVKVAYMAYNQWVAKNGQEPRFPGLNYSPQQMFWISFAQTWCGKYRTEYLKNWITTDPHSPNKFRVLGSLSNVKAFSRDFECPEGAPMNPVHKCEVW